MGHQGPNYGRSETLSKRADELEQKQIQELGDRIVTRRFFRMMNNLFDEVF